MVCLTCHGLGEALLCVRCRRGLRRTPARLLLTGVPVVSAFEHEGAARRLVHLLKYRGVVAVAALAAEELAPRIPRLPLVPVPRVLSRRMRYGIDPALELARAIGRMTGQPVVRCLAAPLHAAPRAGRNRLRPSASYRLIGVVPGQLVLIDDVLTTGATMAAALSSLGILRVRSAATISAVSGMSNLQPK